VSSLSVNGEPGIEITEVATQALVSNGQTLVLGGIFQSEELSDVGKVPFLRDLPGIGRLFRKEMRTAGKREILIFINPKVIDDSLVDK
jgi:type IV pilus assembly protein PilQ